MSAETEKILSRVKKMLTLAGDSGATEGERDNALKMAHATLAKYNLSMSAVEALGDHSRNDPRIEQKFDLDADRMWTRQAAAGVGELFFCFYFTSRRSGDGDKHVYVGKSVNVATATYMAEYVINSIRQESINAAKDYHGECKLNALLDLDGDTRPEASKPAWAEAFCAEAATVVRKRCIALAKAAAAQTDSGVVGTGTSLAVIYEREQDANEAFIRDVLKLNLGQSRGRYNAASIGSARAAGAAYGAKVNLSQQIGNSSATRRLK